MRTLATLLTARVRDDPDRTALRRRAGAGWEDVSWAAYAAQVQRIGEALLALGVAIGDRVAILSSTRLEWLYADLAILQAGAVTVPIYANAVAADVGVILANSEARIAFVEDAAQARRLSQALELSPRATLAHVIVFDGAGLEQGLGLGGATVHTLAALRRDAAGGALEARAREVTPDGLATIVYTSGTTGVPKGVRLTHRTCLAQVDGTNEVFGFVRDDVVVSFLPLAHMMARTTSWRGIHAGYVTVYTTMEAALDELTVVRPTALYTVPRIFEKLHEAVLRRALAAPGAARPALDAAIAWARRRAGLLREGQPLVPAGPEAERGLTLLAEWAREATGGRLRFIHSAGAPLSADVAVFFDALGLTILEGYGLTEAAGGVHENHPHDYRLGTCGRVVPGVQTRIAEDGEVLVRGPTVMQGYHADPVGTREVLDAEGWLHTGDLGKLDADGFLRITGRKKDLFKTSGGKYIAPQKLEGLLRTIPGVSRAAVFGEGRKYCVALLTVDLDAARAIIEEGGERAPDAPDALAAHPSLRRHLEAGVAERNATLASFETIKAFRVLPREFRGDELTPTMKLRRRRVSETQRALIDAMYSSG